MSEMLTRISSERVNTMQDIYKATIEKGAKVFAFRKTNHIAPHEYILRNDINASFFTAVKYKLHTEGELEEFKGSNWRYYYHDDYKYWIIGDVMNRAYRKPIENEQNAPNKKG